MIGQGTDHPIHGMTMASRPSREPVGGRGHELPVDLVIRAGLRCVGGGGDDLLAAYGPLQSHDFHQPFDRAAGDIFSFAPQRMPDLARAVEPAILSPDPSDILAVNDIALSACGRPFWLADDSLMGMEARRGDERPEGLSSGSWKERGQQAAEASRTRQIGSTPNRSRLSSINAIICGTGGRAPPRRGLLTSAPPVMEPPACWPRLGEIGARLLEDLVRLPQLADLALEILDPGLLLARRPGALARITGGPGCTRRAMCHESSRASTLWPGRPCCRWSSRCGARDTAERRARGTRHCRTESVFSRSWGSSLETLTLR